MRNIYIYLRSIYIFIKILYYKLYYKFFTFGTPFRAPSKILLLSVTLTEMAPNAVADPMLCTQIGPHAIADQRLPQGQNALFASFVRFLREWCVLHSCCHPKYNFSEVLLVSIELTSKRALF